MATGDLKALVETAGGYLDEVTALQATSAELLTGTENSRVATPKNLKDAEHIAIHVGTSAPANTSILWLDIT
ncbi:MAG: hypothetical protein ACOYMF_09855 [Bacteroidales bacterium]